LSDRCQRLAGARLAIISGSVPDPVANGLYTELLDLCRAAGVPFIVNDDLALAHHGQGGRRPHAALSRGGLGALRNGPIGRGQGIGQRRGDVWAGIGIVSALDFGHCDLTGDLAGIVPTHTVGHQVESALTLKHGRIGWFNDAGVVLLMIARTADIAQPGHAQGQTAGSR